MRVADAACPGEIAKVSVSLAAEGQPRDGIKDNRMLLKTLDVQRPWGDMSK